MLETHVLVSAARPSLRSLWWPGQGRAPDRHPAPPGHLRVRGKAGPAPLAASTRSRKGAWRPGGRQPGLPPQVSVHGEEAPSWLAQRKKTERNRTVLTRRMSIARALRCFCFPCPPEWPGVPEHFSRLFFKAKSRCGHSRRVALSAPWSGLWSCGKGVDPNLWAPPPPLMCFLTSSFLSCREF